MDEKKDPPLFVNCIELLENHPKNADDFSVACLTSSTQLTTLVRKRHMSVSIFTLGVVFNIVLPR